MKPPPPGPVSGDSVTHEAKPAATAASTALPPSASTRAPTSAVTGCPAAIAPRIFSGVCARREAASLLPDCRRSPSSPSPRRRSCSALTSAARSSGSKMQAPPGSGLPGCSSRRRSFRGRRRGAASSARAVATSDAWTRSRVTRSARRSTRLRRRGLETSHASRCSRASSRIPSARGRAQARTRWSAPRGRSSWHCCFSPPTPRARCRSGLYSASAVCVAATVCSRRGCAPPESSHTPRALLRRVSRARTASRRRRHRCSAGWRSRRRARVGAVAAIVSSLGIQRSLGAALLIIPALDAASLLPLTPGNIGVASGAVVVALHRLRHRRAGGADDLARTARGRSRGGRRLRRGRLARRRRRASALGGARRRRSRVTFQLVARTGHPDFLDLPVGRAARGVGHAALRRGRARHRPPRRAVRRLRRRALRAEGAAARASRSASTGCSARSRESALPVVEAVGVVSARGSELEAVLITRHLDYSLPYRRSCCARGSPGAARPRCSTRSRSCSCACTSPASSGATARCRTRSSAATPARSRRTSSTPRRASCTSSSPTASAAHDLDDRRARTSTGELLDLAADAADRRVDARSRSRRGRRALRRRCGPS